MPQTESITSETDQRTRSKRIINTVKQPKNDTSEWQVNGVMNVKDMNRVNDARELKELLRGSTEKLHAKIFSLRKTS